jgi:hypothetical protein
MKKRILKVALIALAGVGCCDVTSKYRYRLELE